MIEVQCNECHSRFGIDTNHISDAGVVLIPFVCCYCGAPYYPGDKMSVANITGGLNISGKNINISGDAVGGSKR